MSTKFYTPTTCGGCELGSRRLEPFTVTDSKKEETLTTWLDLRCAVIISRDGPAEGITIEHATQYYVLN